MLQLYSVFFTLILYCSGMLMAAAGEKKADGALLKETVLADPKSIRLGEQKFNALCAYCHGSAGAGGKARKLKGRKLQADHVFKTITNGKKRGAVNMPPWRNLPAETRWQLTAYILSLGQDKQ